MRENKTFESGRSSSRYYDETAGAYEPGNNQSAFREKAGPMLTKRKGELVGQIRDTAQVLRETGDNLIGRDKTRGGQYAHKAADRLERYSDYLHQNSVDHIINDVQVFGRERPWITIGGAFILGVAVARFLKSTERS